MANTKVGIEFDLYDRISGGLSNIGAGIDDVTDKLERAPAATQSFGSSLGSLATKLGAIGLATAAASATVGAAWNFAKGSVEAAAQVEGYKIALTTMLGTQNEANKRLAEYQDIAAKTPFELPQVVEAGNQLQALGRYSRENLVMLGDLAAASGKPIEQAMAAYAKLATGQKGVGVDMFRDMMITATDWQKVTGKGITKNGELIATTEEMIAKLPQILQSKGFAGMMAAQSKSVSGGISNMKDSFFQLQAAIGDRFTPEVKSATGMLTEFLQATQKLVEMPVSQKMGEDRMRVNQLATELMNSNTPLDRRREILNELKTLSPEVVAGISAESVELSKLTANLSAYNRQATVNIIRKRNEEKYADMMGDYADAQEKLAGFEQDVTNLGAKAITAANELAAQGKIGWQQQKDLQLIMSEPDVAKRSERLITYIEKDFNQPLRAEMRKGYSAFGVEKEVSKFKETIPAETPKLRKEAETVKQKSDAWMAASNKALDALMGTAKPLEEKATKEEKTVKTTTENKTTNEGISTTGGGTSAVSSTGQAAGTATSGTTIHVKSLVEKIEIHSSVKESIPEIEDEVGRALLRLLNSANGK